MSLQNWQYAALSELVYRRSAAAQAITVDDITTFQDYTSSSSLSFSQVWLDAHGLSLSDGHIYNPDGIVRLTDLETAHSGA